MGKGGVVGGGPTPLTAKILTNHPLDKRGWAVPGGGRLRRGKILITTPVEWRGGKFFASRRRRPKNFFRKNFFSSTPPPFQVPAIPLPGASHPHKTYPLPTHHHPQKQISKNGPPPAGKIFRPPKAAKKFFPTPTPRVTTPLASLTLPMYDPYHEAMDHQRAISCLSF